MRTTFETAPLVVNVETVTIDDVSTYIKPVTVPAHYKDASWVAAFVEETTAARIADAALDVDLCRVVAIGMQVVGGHHRILLCPDEAAERSALQEVWQLVALDGNGTRQLITFDGHHFDLPALVRRSQYLDIRPSRTLNLERYRSPHLDLERVLSFYRPISGHSLAFYAQRFGLAVERPDLLGADVAALVATEDWPTLEAHCASNVALIYALSNFAISFPGSSTSGSPSSTSPCAGGASSG